MLYFYHFQDWMMGVVSCVNINEALNMAGIVGTHHYSGNNIHISGNILRTYTSGRKMWNYIGTKGVRKLIDFLVHLSPHLSAYTPHGGTFVYCAGPDLHYPNPWSMITISPIIVSPELTPKPN